LTNVISPQATYDTDYINKFKRRQPDIGRQISAMMLRFEQLLGITADCECCSQKYKEKIASSRVNEPIAENTEFVQNVFKEGNT
jgi:hypothetical protein